jgi:UDP-galactopyranose mutase
MYKYDYLIVGAGLFGAVFAYEAGQRGKTCLVVEKREHIGGNMYCECRADIQVHRYGPHIFHTNDSAIWAYIGQFAQFNRYTNAPLANFEGELYNLPFNMNTFYKLWGVTEPAAAMKIIASQRQVNSEPANLEEQAIALVGTDIYEKLIKGYTEKQWGRKATELPAFIIKRLPVRFTFDNNYFNDRYQGIPIGGYNQIAQKMLSRAEVLLQTDYLPARSTLDALAAKVIYTGMIDAYYNYRYGALAYRSLRFETELLETPNYQGNAIINYTAASVPYTRIIEHKHFESGQQAQTVITREYPQEWQPELEPYYPVNDATNTEIFDRYSKLARQEERVLFGGRLGDYLYYDMDKVITAALHLADCEFS